MKKVIRAFAIVAAVVMSAISVSSCFMDNHIDSTIFWDAGYKFSVIDGTTDGGIKKTDIDTVISGVFSAEGESFSNTLILRNQHSESQVKNRAIEVANKVEKAIKAAYPNVEQQLSSAYSSLYYTISYSYDGKEREVWTMKIR